MKIIQRLKRIYLAGLLIVVGLIVLGTANGFARETAGQKGRRQRAPLPPTLGLDQGTIDLSTPDFTLKLVRASQTVAALQSRGAGGFDFTPSDRLEQRSGDGFFHLGDLTLRVRGKGSDSWRDMNTAAARKPVQGLRVQKPVLAAADLSATLPPDCPFHIVRTWALEGGKLTLSFSLRNRTKNTVQLGSLGFPMIFNNIISRRSLKEAHEVCSFFDPYIGMDAGYLQVTRLIGSGPALVVVPVHKTPFEAYHLLREPMRPNQTFEGSFEWLVHSLAFAEKEWQGVVPWNDPTVVSIPPGETVSYGVKFLLSDTIRNIEDTIAAANRPVAVSVPGTILPMDLDGRLFLKHTARVISHQVQPEGAIVCSGGTDIGDGWLSFTVHGRRWGRARLTVTYQDGLRQSLHYYVIKPSQQVVSDLGQFLFTRQWYDVPDDPFGRSPSVMSYDRETDRIVLQDGRVWIAGLGDEGGSDSWLAAAMKEFVQPKKEELAKYERFVNEVMWGGIQYSEGERQYGVLKSMFYYAPEEMPKDYYDARINWKSWTSWDKKGAMAVNRSYDYPHVAAAYWVMYRLRRNYTGLVCSHPWQWYLERAFHTGQAMAKFAGRYARHGQMDGTVFVKILSDLKREGWLEKAKALEITMKKRADRWNGVAFPFGSEMAWDSTGQEEVYAWCKYFGYEKKAGISLNSILGYMPLIPHWGYNGNARRYWDFLYGGKLRRIERQLHHYGSGLNAIPVLSEYRQHPGDFYLLRVGYAGTMGALSNIDRDGFASAAFHSFPDTLAWDAYSGDYGPNFFGHAINSATYLINHAQFGWLAFGGNARVSGKTVRIKVLDSMRKRVYIASYGLWLTLESGSFEEVLVDTQTNTIRLGFAAATAHAPTARLIIRQPAKIAGVGIFHPLGKYPFKRDAYEIQLKPTVTWIEVGEKAN